MKERIDRCGRRQRTGSREEFIGIPDHHSIVNYGSGIPAIPTRGEGLDEV